MHKGGCRVGGGVEVRVQHPVSHVNDPTVQLTDLLPFSLGLTPQITAERHSIGFELEDMKTGPNTEPFLTELLHQAAYKNNTLGLPSICPEENLQKITASELRQFLASHYVPSRMVLTGVNVDHQQLVELAREHFVDPHTSWEGVEPRAVDGSIAQYNSGEVKVSRGVGLGVWFLIKL